MRPSYQPRKHQPGKCGCIVCSPRGPMAQANRAYFAQLAREQIDRRQAERDDRRQAERDGSAPGGT